MSRGKIKNMLLIGLGIVVAIIPFFFRMGDRNRSDQYIWQFNQEENEDEKMEKKDNKKKNSQNNVLSSGNIVGIVEIPSLNIRYPVFEGVSGIQLNEGIGHMEKSAALCSKGNCVLAGHNGSHRGIYFTYLCNIEIGEKVKVTNKNKVTHEYTVREMKTVNPYNSWVTEESETELLTLFTCANHGTNRFVVKCVPEEDYYD